VLLILIELATWESAIAEGMQQRVFQHIRRAGGGQHGALAKQVFRPIAPIRFLLRGGL